MEINQNVPAVLFFFLFFCFLVMNKSRRRGICGVGAWAWELGIHGRHLSRSRNNDDAGGGRETHLIIPHNDDHHTHTTINYANQVHTLLLRN